MHLPGSSQSPRFRPRPPGSGPRSPGLAFVAVLVVALAIFVLVLPHSVVLPVFSLWALSAAACAALLAIFPLRTRTLYAGAAWDMMRMRSTRSMTCSMLDTGVAGFIVTPAFLPSARIACSERCT